MANQPTGLRQGAPISKQKGMLVCFLDLGATSGAVLEEDKQEVDDIRDMSRKTFMFPNGQTRKAAKKMLLKHNLHIAA